MMNQMNPLKLIKSLCCPTNVPSNDEDKVDDDKQRDLPLTNFSSTKKWRTNMELG